MRTLHKIRWLFWGSVICFTLMSATILGMPFAAADESSNTPKIVLGILFWSMALLGTLMICRADRKRKRLLHNRPGLDPGMGRRPGIFTVFSSIPGTIFDVLGICSVTAFIIFSFTDLWNSYIPFVLLFLIFLSVGMHCLFNGRVYKTTKIKHLRRREK